MSKAKKTLRVKVISIGNSEVGKSCIIKRYCEKRFVPKYLQTIGIDYGVTKVSLKDRDVKVNIFDMSGHVVFHEVRNEFYKDTQGAILVFDVSDRASFDSLDEWINEMKHDLELANSNNLENVVFAICGNKIDKGKRVVDELEARMWAQLKGYHYFETSASSGAGINEMFETLLNEIVLAFENGGKPVNMQTNSSLSKEQMEAIQRLNNSKDNYERLGLKMGCTKEEINNSFRRLAKLLHPDKNVYPGAGDAFKLLLNAKTDLLKNFS
jgi:DnaJ family protein C protein 27